MTVLDPRPGGLLRSALPDVAWPPVLDRRTAGLAALVHRLDRTQWLPPDDVRRLGRQQLSVLARWFDQVSPWFTARLGAAGLRPVDLARPGALEQLPLLHRDEYQALGESLFVEPPAGHGTTSSVSSSGSTGQRVTTRKTGVTTAYFAGLTARDHLWRDLDLAGRACIVRATTDVGDRPSWGPPLAPLLATGPARVVSVYDPVDAIAERVRDFRPSFLLCYPTVLRELLAAGALDGVRHTNTISEAVPQELPSQLAAAGIATWDLYSSMEVGPIASECPDVPGTFHAMAENLVVEIVDAAGRPVGPGEVGDVVVTDLHNLATPLVRYRLGDLAVAGDGPCPCGRGLPALGRVLGRERNLLVLADGTRRWPRFRGMDLGAVAGVVQNQLVQTSVDVVEARVVPSRPLAAADVDAIVEAVRIAVGDVPHVVVVPVERIERAASGKFEDFRSEVRS